MLLGARNNVISNVEHIVISNFDPQVVFDTLHSHRTIHEKIDFSVWNAEINRHYYYYHSVFFLSGHDKSRAFFFSYPALHMYGGGGNNM